MPSADSPTPSTSASEPDFRRLVDGLPGMVFTGYMAPKWPMKWTSAGCFALTGYTSEELVVGDGLCFSELILPEDRAAVFAAIERSVESREAYVTEYRIRDRNGELKWVWEKGRALYDGEGQAVGVEGFITDITARKLSEQTLKQAQQRLHSIFDNTAEGIFQTSVDGTSYYNINPALARIYGYESAEAMMAQLVDIEHQLYVDPTRRNQFVGLLDRRDRVLDFESQVRRRDGTVIWISENARAVRDEQGKLLYYEGTVEDITERKAAEQALAKERNMLRTVIDAWPDIIYVKDTDGRYVLSNKAHTRNLHMTEPAEIVGRKPEDFFVASRAAALGNEDLEIMSTGRAVINREEVRLGSNNEQRWYLCAKLPLQDAAGNTTGLVSLSRDITEHKQTAEQLRQSQKMEAIGRLAGGVAHDFNNILTAILGYSEMIARNAGEDEMLKHDIEQIHSGGLRAAALTQQLLAFSRKQVSLPKAMSVNRVIASMEQMLRRLIGENIRLETRLDERIQQVHADAHQIEQVIMNLVVNSRDAITDSGLILVETSEVYLGVLSAQQTLDVVPGSYVRVAITDDGRGIPKEIQDRIFEPFFTTKGQGKGTGLGLATSYGIIQQSGGHIRVHSEPDCGTTFSIFLPVGRAEEEPVAKSTARRELPTGDETILVAEDDPSVRHLTCSLLEGLGYRVIAASDGEDALTVFLDNDRPPIDLLLTDVVMPRLGGKKLAERVRVLAPRTRILFTSGYNEEEVLQQGIRTGEIAFIAKPFATDALAQKVREVLDEPPAHGHAPQFEVVN